VYVLNSVALSRYHSRHSLVHDEPIPNGGPNTPRETPEMDSSQPSPQVEKDVGNVSMAMTKEGDVDDNLDIDEISENVGNQEAQSWEKKEEQSLQIIPFAKRRRMNESIIVCQNDEEEDEVWDEELGNGEEFEDEDGDELNGPDVENDAKKLGQIVNCTRTVKRMTRLQPRGLRHVNKTARLREILCPLVSRIDQMESVYLPGLEEVVVYKAVDTPKQVYKKISNEIELEDDEEEEEEEVENVFGPEDEFGMHSRYGDYGQGRTGLVFGRSSVKERSRLFDDDRGRFDRHGSFFNLQMKEEGFGVSRFGRRSLVYSPEDNWSVRPMMYDGKRWRCLETADVFYTDNHPHFDGNEKQGASNNKDNMQQGSGERTGNRTGEFESSRAERSGLGNQSGGGKNGPRRLSGDGEDDDDDDGEGWQRKGNNSDVNNNSAIGAELFPCLICKVSYADKHDLMRHLSKIHRLTNLCQICYFDESEIRRFANPVSLRNHKVRDHPEEMVRCVCGTMLIDTKMLSSHLKKFQCDKIVDAGMPKELVRCVCGKRFVSQEQLMSHRSKCRKRSLDPMERHESELGVDGRENIADSRDAWSVHGDMMDRRGMEEFRDVGSDRMVGLRTDGNNNNAAKFGEEQGGDRRPSRKRRCKDGVASYSESFYDNRFKSQEHLHAFDGENLNEKHLQKFADSTLPEKFAKRRVPSMISEKKATRSSQGMKVGPLHYGPYSSPPGPYGPYTTHGVTHNPLMYQYSSSRLWPSDANNNIALARNNNNVPFAKGYLRDNTSPLTRNKTISPSSYGLRPDNNNNSTHGRNNNMTPNTISHSHNNSSVGTNSNIAMTGGPHGGHLKTSGSKASSTVGSGTNIVWNDEPEEPYPVDRNNNSGNNSKALTLINGF